MKITLKSLEECLGYEFKDTKIITQALTHRSYIKAKNNERLEFLGDAVLDLIVGEYLFKKFEDLAEGELSKLRASLVNEKGFQKLAKKLDLGRYILISIAEENNNGREKASILSNAFEALMGAIYLESGLDAVRTIVTNLLESVYPKIDMQSIFKDYKTTLQEITQAEFGVTPTYKLIRSFGPDHQKEFEVCIMINNEKLATSLGKTKKEAEQNCAKKALEILKKDTHE
ncbi:MAG: ribonuclease III [Campylobacteraceae bacterium]